MHIQIALDTISTPPGKALEPENKLPAIKEALLLNTVAPRSGLVLQKIL